MGIIGLIALILSAVGYVMAKHKDKRTQIIAGIGAVLGLLVLIYEFIRMVF